MIVSILENSQKLCGPDKESTGQNYDLTRTENVKKYGAINEQPTELTFNEIIKNYEDRGWNKSIITLIHADQDLKQSIHQGKDKTEYKTPVSLKRLDKIKGEDYLNESVEDDDEWTHKEFIEE